MPLAIAKLFALSRAILAALKVVACSGEVLASFGDGATFSGNPALLLLLRASSSKVPEFLAFDLWILTKQRSTDSFAIQTQRLTKSPVNHFLIPDLDQYGERRSTILRY